MALPPRPDSQYPVPGDDRFYIADGPTQPSKGAPAKRVLERRPEAAVNELTERHRPPDADEQHATLLIYQALAAAGTARCATVWR